MKFVFCRQTVFNILFFVFGVGCVLLSWKLGKYIREKDYIIYSEKLGEKKHEVWEIAIRKEAFPECFDTEMALRVYDGLEKGEKEKNKLLRELQFKIIQERKKMEKRKDMALKRDRLRLIQILIEPNH